MCRLSLIGKLRHRQSLSVIYQASELLGWSWGLPPSLFHKATWTPRPLPLQWLLSVTQLISSILSGKQVQEPISCFIMRKCSHVSSSVVSYFEITNCVGIVSFQKLNHWNLSILHLWRINSYGCSQKWGKSEAGRSLFTCSPSLFHFFFFFLENM